MSPRQRPPTVVRMSYAASAAHSNGLEAAGRRGGRQSVVAVAALLASPLAWFAFRPRVSGREHLPAGGCVVSANHLSGFDAWALAYALRPRRVWFMGKNDLFRRRVARLVVCSLGVFPARSQGELHGGVEVAAELAQAGERVAIFPEGARRRGRVRRPRHGAARVALTSGVPLVPVAIAGTDGWRRLVSWHVVVGAPVPLDDLRGETGEAPVHDATARLWSAILGLEAEISA
jgi:1-acyl-sn-glycerol-3-phosphate acyltransferase